jgi:hypothetical protein
VPHPRRVLVFAAWMGIIEPQPQSVSQNPQGMPIRL